MGIILAGVKQTRRSSQNEEKRADGKIWGMLLKSIALRWGILLVVWGVCLPMLFLISRQERLSPKADCIHIESSRAGFGGFGYARWEPKPDGRLLHHISFDNLHIESSDLGIFKTAMSREMVFEGLKLRLHNYESSNFAEVSGSAIEDLAGRGSPFSERIAGRLLSYLKRYPQVLPAARNITGLRINEFDCELFCDDSSKLSVTSAKAEFSGLEKEMVLRGRVVIKSNNGRTLRANHIRWDIVEDKFRVKGIYALDCEHGIISGRDAFFNEELFPTDEQKKLLIKERGKWCAQLPRGY